MSGEPKAQAWLPLREELSIHAGPSGLFGAPSWTMSDPAAHRFFRLGWLEFEVFSRWPLADPEAIAQSIARETTLHPDQEAVKKIYNFALANNLLAAQSPADSGRLLERRKRSKVPWHKLAMKSYLFFRVPLVKPDAFLTRSYPVVAPLFSRTFLAVLCAAALLSLYLILRQWALFTDSLALLASWEGWVLVGLALLLSKSVHELGHGYAAKRVGLHVPAMGVALMCFAPVLWTDTTEAWRLESRRDRLLIGLSGVLAEIVLATLASWAWLLLPPGPARSAAFVLASTTWVMTLLVNANPLMRYDAYYILSDVWEAPSLQNRAFELARWWLRRLLFGLPDEQPEHLPAGRKLRFLVYAYACWVYRFFLFLGIALLVYHMFFKLLGIVLFLVEIAFFIAVPILKELRVWWQRRADILKRPRGKAVTALLGLVLLAGVWPWSGEISAPGLLMAERQTGLYAPQPALVREPAEMPVAGRRVKQGDLLLALYSPELEYEAASVRKEAALMAARLSIMSLDARQRESYQVAWENYQGLLHGGLQLEERLDRLIIRAPFDGTLTDVPVWCRAGQWVRPDERLGLLVSDTFLVAAYVGEMDLERLRLGESGTFYPDGGWSTPLPLKIISIDSGATRDLPYPELASSHGGALGVPPRLDKRLVPEAAVYKVLCRVELPEADIPRQSLTGSVSLRGETRSLLAAVLQNALGLAIRESGL